MKKFNLVVLLLLVTCSFLQAEDVISINIVENAGNQIPTGGELVGPIEIDSTYWNHNSSPTTGDFVNGTLENLIDETGAETGVNIEWHCSNTYWNNDGTGDDAHKLSVGYLDDGDGSDGDGKGVIITIANIPYDVYKIYGLFSSDQGDPAGIVNFDVNGTWALGGDATTTADAWGSIDDNNTANGSFWTEIEPGMVKGNYWSVVTTGETCVITGEVRNGANRGSLTAIQIERFCPAYSMITSPEKGVDLQPLDAEVVWDAPCLGTATGYDLEYRTDPNFNAGGTMTVSLDASATSYVFGSNDDLLDWDTVYYMRVVATGDAVLTAGPVSYFQTAPEVPVVTEDPLSQTVADGGTATFTVADNNGTTYKWFKFVDGVNDIAVGTNDPMLTIDNVDKSSEGAYYCNVSNSALAEGVDSGAAWLWTPRLMTHFTFDDTLVDSVDGWVGQYNDPNVDNDPPTPVFDNGNVAIAGGSSIVLDGSGLFVEVLDSVDFFDFYTEGYTVAAWVQSTTPDAWGAIACKQENGFGWVLNTDMPDAVTTLRDAGVDLYGETDINDGQWHYVVGQYDPAAASMKVFVDGVLENSRTFEGTVSPNTNPLLIGVERVDGGVAFAGLIDDLKIWSYAVDDFDVARMYTDVMTDEFVCVSLPEFDFNEDCVTNLEDFAIFAATWLDCTRVAGSESSAIDCYGQN